jgi:hypothetical protein
MLYLRFTSKFCAIAQAKTSTYLFKPDISETLTIFFGFPRIQRPAQAHSPAAYFLKNLMGVLYRKSLLFGFVFQKPPANAGTRYSGACLPLPSLLVLFLLCCLTRPFGMNAKSRHRCTFDAHPQANSEAKDITRESPVSSCVVIPAHESDDILGAGMKRQVV